MEDRLRRIAVVVTPLFAAATVALGLRVGAPAAMRVASIYAAPAASGRSHVVWQVVTYTQELGVKEAIPMKDLRLVVRGQGREASWTGESNKDGVAEARLDIAPRDGESLDVEMFQGALPIANGSFVFRPTWTGPTEGAQSWVRPTRREGAIRLDVAARGERLAAGFAGTLFVRAVDASSQAPLEGVTIAAEPEPGLEVASSPKPTCDAGWTELKVTPLVHVVGATLRARKNDGKTGEWFGGLPVAGGADAVDLPIAIAENRATSVQLLTPGVRDVVYAEVDDARGRAFATTLLFPRSAGFAGVSIAIPPLPKGQYWLVTSGEPRGAESLSGAAVARPFDVVADEGALSCSAVAAIGARTGGGFKRELVVDGVDRSPEKRRRQLGLAIAVAALLVAATLEALLLLQGAQRARDTIAAAFREDDQAAERVARRPVTGSIAVGILVALLGFALFAALLLWRG